MSKKLIAALMALTAFTAFGVSATSASAAPVLTHPTGTVAPVGTLVTGTNVGETEMNTSFGKILCSSAVLTGTLTQNSTASGTKGEVTSATFQGTGETASNGDKECTSWTGGVTVTPNVSGGLPWCLEATSGDEGKVRGGKCSELSRGIKFVLDFTSIGTCEYNRSTAAVGTLTTHPEDAVVHLVEQEWSKVGGTGGVLCPSTGKLTMTFTLETDTSASKDPMYFSS